MKKTELEAALDAHLSQNKNRLASESKLSDYYERLARPPRGSPIKKEPKVEVTSFDGSSSVKRSTRRRSVKPKEEVEATCVFVYLTLETASTASYLDGY